MRGRCEDCVGDVLIYIDQATGASKEADDAIFQFL